MNFHTDEWVMNGMHDHYNAALEYFDETHIVGLFCQGSTNYGLDMEWSDLDTKLITTPYLKELVFNKKPVSTTHVRANEEHIDFKDVRLYMNTFRKGNLNFLEILFTPYCIINPMYQYEWQTLVDNRELIAHMDMGASVKAMYGMATEKFHALEHRYPAKVAIIDQFGFDTKQLHHLIRIEMFLRHYLEGMPYEKCLRPEGAEFRYLKMLKTPGSVTLNEARELATNSLARTKMMCDNFVAKYNKETDYKHEADIILNSTLYKIITKSIDNDLAACHTYWDDDEDV